MTGDAPADRRTPAGATEQFQQTSSQTPAETAAPDQSAPDLHADLEELSSLQERLAAKLSAADS